MKKSGHLFIVIEERERQSATSAEGETERATGFVK